MIMSFYGYFRIFVIGFFGFLPILLIFVCPALDIAKIVIFNQTDGKLKVNGVEYAYLSSTLLLMATFFCCILCIIGQDSTTKIYASSLSCCLPCIWIIIPVIYTALTINELRDIPFFCPSNYNYTLPKIRLACQIRTANFICMWSFSISILLFFLIFCFLPKNNNNHRLIFEDILITDKDKIDKIVDNNSNSNNNSNNNLNNNNNNNNNNNA